MNSTPPSLRWIRHGCLFGFSPVHSYQASAATIVRPVRISADQYRVVCLSIRAFDAGRIFPTAQLG